MPENFWKTHSMSHIISKKDKIPNGFCMCKRLDSGFTYSFMPISGGEALRSFGL